MISPTSSIDADALSAKLVKQKMRIALVNVLNESKKTAMNKDLNGGFGTCDEYGDSWSSRILKFLKKKSIRLPIISFAFLQAIFKRQGHYVHYFEGELPRKKGNEGYDLMLIYGTVVDYNNENSACRLLKGRFPEAKVGFFGPFPSRNAGLFASGDFVLAGESEGFFLKDFKDLEQLRGHVPVSSPTNLDELPSPDYDGFPLDEYSYNPAISKKPFLVLQASKGCPYNCRFYCPYGEYQGAKIRQRSAKKTVDDIVELQNKYGMQGVQFRDPVFGLNKDFIPEFCDEMKKRNVKISWGMETRLDLLTRENVKAMYDVGLRNVNAGIETSDPIIAKKNKRLLVEESHQERMINYCKELGVNVSAFYILALDGDTEGAIEKTIQYAISLNTPLARFSVSTPYPGTGFYDQLEKEGRILTKDYEKYNQFTLVHKHPNLTPEQVRGKLESAYRKYYFRPAYLVNFILWKIRTSLS